MPLDPIQQEQLVAYLTERLATSTLDAIVEEELDVIYDWPHMPNSATKRLYRNYSLAYSRAELKSLLLRTYTSALDAEFPSDDRLPPPEAPPEETPIETPGDTGSGGSWTPQVPLDPEAADPGANGADGAGTERESGWDRAGWAAAGVREAEEIKDMRMEALDNGLIAIVGVGFSFVDLEKGLYDLIIAMMNECICDMFDGDEAYY